MPSSLRALDANGLAGAGGGKASASAAVHAVKGGSMSARLPIDLGTTSKLIDYWEMRIEELRSLEASVAVVKEDRESVVLRGELTATVAQRGVTTGDLIVSDITAPIDFWVVVSDGESDVNDDDRDVVETPDGMVNLGEIIVQTLSLEVDPYPVTTRAGEEEPVARIGDARDVEDAIPNTVGDALQDGYGGLDM